MSIKDSYLWKGVSLAFQLQVGRRDFIPDDNSIALVSFPKSGNTWVRSLFGCLITKRDLSLSEMEDIIPDIYKKKLIWLNSESPRYFKSHEIYNPNYNKVIYIVRDPRDVLVSYYYYQKAIGQLDDTITINEYLELFLTGKQCSFGSWANHVGSWFPSVTDNNFMLVRYEDLKANPIEVVLKLCDFAGISVNEQDVAEAVNNNTLSKMKSKSDGWKEGFKSGNSSGFFRSGEKNNYLNELNEVQIDRIESKFGFLMKKMGYLSSD